MINKIAVVMICCCFTAQAFSDQISNELQTRLNSIRTMSASFSQTVKARKKNIAHSTGTMALSRPGRFRWKTQRPMAQLLVADGKRLWIYDADLEQVSVKRQGKGLGGTAALFLSGYNHSVAQNFDINMSKQGNTTHFDLRAKSPKAGFQRVKLIFNGNALTGLELYDQLGQYTVVHLSNVKIHPALPTGLFQFKIPKGVDVVEQ